MIILERPLEVKERLKNYVAEIIILLPKSKIKK